MSTTGEISAPSGLEYLRAAIGGRGPELPMVVTMGFLLEEVDEGRVVFSATPHAAVVNPLGAAHGGYAATLLDSCCGGAVHSALRAGLGCTTLELKVSYHKALTIETGPVRAEGRVVSLGRRAAFAEARITDAQGRLYASATSTLLVFDV